MQGQAATLITDPSDSLLVTGITNLDVGGTFYDVQFHTGASFDQIWDVDSDLIFGEGDASLIDQQPTFWGGNYSGALAAAQAISTALGTQYYLVGEGTPSDFFLVPYQVSGMLKGLPHMVKL